VCLRQFLDRPKVLFDDRRVGLRRSLHGGILRCFRCLFEALYIFFVSLFDGANIFFNELMSG
jgi:hypothetical protein